MREAPAAADNEERGATCVLKTKKRKKGKRNGAARPTPNVTFFVCTFFLLLLLPFLLMSPKTHPVHLKSRRAMK